MMYDMERIREDAEPAAVAKYLGMRMCSRGRNVFIECPEHEKLTGKADRRVTNCILGDGFRNAYYCFSCGARGSLVDMVAAYEGLDPRKDFGKVLGIISEASGGGYEKPDDGSWREEKEKRTCELVLTPDEMAFLGLRVTPWVTCVTDVMDGAEAGEMKEGYEKGAAFKEGKRTEYFAGTRRERFDFSGCRGAYIEVLKVLAREKLEKYEKVSEMGVGDVADLFRYEGDLFSASCALDIARRRKIEAERIVRKLEKSCVG